MINQLEFDFHTKSQPSLDNNSNGEVLDVFGAAEYLKLSPKTIRCYARGRKIPAKKIGSQWRFLKSLLDRWLSGEYPEGEQKPAGVVSTSENKQCHYLNVATGSGSILGIKGSAYEDLLGL